MEEQGFVNFIFYKLDPQWRRLPSDERELGGKEFVSVVERHQSRLWVRPYLTLGLREDADFLLWVRAPEVEAIQELVADLYATGLGRYLNMPYAYLAMIRESQYTREHKNPPQVLKEGYRYLIVYPFIKSRDWYLLSFDARQGMMNEHIKVGHEFPTVKINTCYSFGLDDQDFVVAFETNSLSDFQELVIRLRETEASRYTVRDTPMMVCVSRDLREIVQTLNA